MKYKQFNSVPEILDALSTVLTTPSEMDAFFKNYEELSHERYGFGIWTYLESIANKTYQANTLLNAAFVWSDTYEGDKFWASANREWLCAIRIED